MAARKQYWLIKSEPSVYPWSKLVTDGKTRWEGVRNYEARNNLRAMKVGDLALYYHSNEGKQIVGVARVRSAHYQDPTTREDWSVVDFEPVLSLAEPVSLAAIKANATLADMGLVKKGRISVVPVTREEFDTVLAMSGTKRPRG